MKKLSKALCLLVIAALVLSLCSCGNSGSGSNGGSGSASNGGTGGGTVSTSGEPEPFEYSYIIGTWEKFGESVSDGSALSNYYTDQSKWASGLNVRYEFFEDGKVAIEVWNLSNPDSKLKMSGTYRWEEAYSNKDKAESEKKKNEDFLFATITEHSADAGAPEYSSDYDEIMLLFGHWGSSFDDTSLNASYQMLWNFQNHFLKKK